MLFQIMFQNILHAMCLKTWFPAPCPGEAVEEAAAEAVEEVAADCAQGSTDPVLPEALAPMRVRHTVRHTAQDTGDMVGFLNIRILPQVLLSTQGRVPLMGWSGVRGSCPADP